MLDVPSKVLQKKRVARILVFKIRPSQDILKIRDGTPLEAEEILTYRKSPQNGSVWHFSSKLDIPSNVLQKKRVAHILVFKIRPSQDILKIRDGTPLEAEEILTYRKKPSKWIVKKRVARILVFKIRPYQEILKIRDGTIHLEKKRVARILFFKIWPSQKILKIRDGTPLEAEEILTYRKSPQNGSVWYFSSKLDIPSNVLQKKRVAHILVFKIRPSQDILKIRDGTPLEAEEILTYRKKPSKWIESSQEIHKIRDGTPLEVEEILTYIKKPRNGSFGTFLASYMSLVMYYRRKEWHGFWFSKLDHLKKFSKFKKRVARILVFKIRPYQEILKIRDEEKNVPSKVLQKKRVARILVFKIRPSQDILKIRDGTPLEAEEILTYRKSPQNGSVWYFSSKLDILSNVLQKKRVAHILVFKIRPSQDILKIRDGTPLEAEEILTYRKKPSKWIVLQKKRVVRILVFKIRSSQEIHKIRDGTPLEVEEILTYIKKPRNGSKEWHGFWFSKLDHLKKFSKFMPYQEILKIRDEPSQDILKIRDESTQEIHKIREDTPLEVEEILTYIKKPRNGSKEWHGFWFSKLDHLKKFSKFKRVARILKKRVARILFFKIWPSQKILKIRDGTPLEAEEILTYRKSPQNGSVWYFSSKLDIPSNVLQKKRVAHILVFKIRPSQDILKIRDGTPLEAEEILTYRKKPSKWIVKKRVVRILVFKIRSSQEIHKIRDGTPLEVEEILTYIKKPRNGSFGTFLASYMSLVMYYRRKEWHGFWFSKLDHLKKFSKFKKRVARILFFKIWPSQKILKIRDGTPLEAEEILTYRKSPQNGSVWYFSSKLDIPSNVLQKKRVAHILVFKIRPSQDILKIRDGTPLEAEEILTYRKKPSKWIESSQEIHKIRDGTPLEKKRVARILFFKIWPSQKILKIRDGTPLEAEEILTYRKSPQNGSVWYFSSKLDIPSNVLQKKRVAHILVFKIRPSQDILKIRDGTPLEAEEILTYRKKPSKWIVMSSQEIHKIRDGTPLEWHGFWFSKLDHLKKFSKFKKRVARILCKLDVPSKVLQKKRVARILVFKIRPSQDILKIRDGTPLEAEEILTYRKSPQNGSVWYFSSKLDILSNVLQKKRVAHILVFKIRPSQDILKIRDGTPLEAEEILTYRKKPSKWIVKRVVRILVFKIRSSQEIHKIRDGTPLEVEEILTYIKKPRNGSFGTFLASYMSLVMYYRRKEWHGFWFSKLDHLKKFSKFVMIPIWRPYQEILKIRDVLQKKRVARILVFKIRPSQDILKIRDVVRILVFKIRSTQEIHKIRDDTPLEVEEILTYIKKPRNGSFGTFLASYMSLVMYYRRKEWHGFWFSKLDHLKKFSKFVMIPIWRVARILVFKIRPSQDILKIRDESTQEIHKIRDDTPLEKKRVARILVFKIRPSQEILKIHVPSKVLQKKRVARILVFKIRPSQDILKIRDESTQEIHKIREDTPLEVEEILTYIKKPRNGSFGTFLASYMSLVMYYRRKEWHGFWFSKLDHLKKFSKFKKRVARILFFKIWPSQKILKIRDGTPLEAEEILTYRKSPQNGSVWYFSSKLDIPSNVLQKKRVAHILVFKIRPSQDILKIRDGTPLEAEEILTYRKKPSKWIESSQEIHKIRDGTPLEVEEILTYIKKPRNGSFGTFLASYMSLVMYYRRKEWHGFWFSKLDHLKKFSKFKKRVARILVFKIRPYQEILKIRDDVPSNVLQKKRVARILFFKIWPSQKILKIRDGTPLEAEEILTYRKSPQNGSVWYFSSKLDIPSNVLQKKRVAHILVFKIRPSQDILKIRDGTPLEAEEILTYRKKPSKWIESSQEIHKIRDGTPLEVEEILTYIKKPRNGSKEWHGFWFSKLDHLKKFSKFKRVARILKKRVARILFFKIWPSQKILKIRDGTPLEAEEILTYRKSPQNGSVWYFSSKLDIPSNVLQKKRVAHILVFKIRPSQDILKIRDGTPLEAEEILTYRKKPSKWIESSQEIHKIRDGTPLEKKRVARILFFKIWPSQKILKIRDGTPLEAEEILTYRKSPQNGSVWYFSSKLDIPSNVLQKKRVAHILVFKIRPSQDILKIRDGTPLEAEEILTYRKKPSKWIESSQEIHKIRDGTPLEVEEILTYIKKPRNGSFGTFLASYMSLVMYYRRKEWHGFWFSKLDHLKKFSKFLDVPSKVLQKKRVARILVFKIRPSQDILKIRDGTPLEAEEILTYRKSPQNGSVWYFSSKLDILSNVLQKKRVAHILVFKIRPSQDILKIRDGTPLEAEEILTYRKKPSKWIESSQEIHKIRDGTPLEVEEILTYIKKPRNGSKEWHGFWPYQEILKIRDESTQEIHKIRDDTPLEKKRVARILFFKIWPSQKILKIRDGTPLEAEEILTYRKSPQNGSVWYFSSKLDIPSNVLQKKRVAHILVFKIRPSQDILKIRDGTPLEAEEILTYRKKPSKWIESSQEIHKIREGTPLEWHGF
ncbi:hypothetical protein OROHE_007051 [Orobanche hederae]